MSSRITLVCLVQGDTPKHAFPVDTYKYKLIGHLKEFIKNKNKNLFSSVDANNLKLWKVNIRDDEFQEREFYDKYELLATRKIGYYWNTQPSGDIHIIVSPPPTTIKLCSAIQENIYKDNVKISSRTVASKLLPFICKWTQQGSVHSEPRRFICKRDLMFHYIFEHVDDTMKLYELKSVRHYLIICF
ncbi:hypothetical protein C1645_201157 [Glomus cerebriforme]|uniref:Crinkler effector protein N-terminal domain-containing protein n=1 Tax=Glomus cerebriforme TaxID=658196 RepID=A0A397STC0_9GLOM|nr:hypothetical protein C1645_201157 [Glomus cerebriforme]